MVVAAGCQQWFLPGTGTPEKVTMTPSETQQSRSTITPSSATRTPAVTATTSLPETTPVVRCQLGLGLRQETADILVEYREFPGLVMTANFLLAEAYFPDLEGWTRTLGGPSLQVLENRSNRAAETGLAYEGLSYGLETSQTTPAEEWQNLVTSAEQARLISDRSGKLLLLGPGMRLMEQHEESYPDMATLTDIWMIQTQRFQLLGPGEDYRREVERIVDLIHQSDPSVEIWAQINLLPDRSPDPDEWLAYQEAIRDLVTGTYIGVYIWDTTDPAILRETLYQIFEQACLEDGV
jgi:hypothetical protein